MGLIFPRGKFSRRMPYREKRENYPHAKISTFTVSAREIKRIQVSICHWEMVCFNWRICPPIGRLAHVHVCHNASHTVSLKLYCRYLYTIPYMINRILSLKQLWLQVNGHAWFHLHGLRWPVRNGDGAKNSKWKYMFPAGFEPTPRQSMTGKSAP